MVLGTSLTFLNLSLIQTLILDVIDRHLHHVLNRSNKSRLLLDLRVGCDADDDCRLEAYVLAVLELGVIRL